MAEHLLNDDITGAWHILLDKKTKKRDIYYFNTDYGDDFEHEFGESLADKEEIPFQNWTSEEITEVVSSMMEDKNMHRYLYWPELVNDSMAAAGAGEDMKKKVMSLILKDIAVR